MNVFESIKLKHFEMTDHMAEAAFTISMGNPLTGIGNEYDMTPVEKAKQVIVIGGGISGCEAAISAAIKGHKVMLMERNDCLGGQWSQSFIPFDKEEFSSFIFWQNLMLEKLHVQVLLNTVADSELIELYSPDAAIVAVGEKEDKSFLDDLNIDSCKVIKAGEAKNGYEKIREGFEAGLNV